MSFDVLTLTPANGAGRRDEIVFAYPSGRSASDYETTGAYLDINAGELKYRQADEVFSVSYKADGVHVAWTAGPVVPAGKVWTLRAPLTRDAEIAAGSPLTIGSVTDSVGNWVSYGNFVPVALNDSTKAAANVAMIQAALNNGGRVNLVGAGVAYINATLTIGSSTHLWIDPRLTIKLAPGTGKTLLRTSVSYATPTTVTLSWSAGKECSVAWTGHGLSAGDYVWLSGATSGEYLGLFPVKTVTDANNVVVMLERVPTAAPSGTIGARVPARNITIEGGTWDYDYANQGSPSGVDTQAVVLVGIAGGGYDNITVQNAYKYCLTVSAVANFRGGRAWFPTTRSDGLKIYGPAFHVRIGQITGGVGDDFVSIQPKEATGFMQYALSEGDILDLEIDELNQFKNGTSVAIFTVYAHDTYVIDDVRVKNIKGNVDTSALRGANIRASGDVTTGLIRSLSVDGISCRASLPASVQNVTIDRLFVGLVEPRQDGDNTDNGNYSLVHVKIGSTVREMTVSLTFTDASYGSVNQSYPIRLDSAVNNVLVRDSYFKAATGCRFIYLGYAVDALALENNNITSDHLVTVIAAATAPEITIGRGYYACNTVVNAQVSANVRCIGPVFPSSGNGIVRAQGTAAVDFTSVGTKLRSGNWMAVPSGTPTINPKSLEISGDVTATYIGRATGNLLNNSNAAAGTLGAAGPVVCQGTTSGSWHLMADPTKTY